MAKARTNSKKPSAHRSVWQLLYDLAMVYSIRAAAFRPPLTSPHLTPPLTGCFLFYPNACCIILIHWRQTWNNNNGRSSPISEEVFRVPIHSYSNHCFFCFFRPQNFLIFFRSDFFLISCACFFCGTFAEQNNGERLFLHFVRCSSSSSSPVFLLAAAVF